MKMATVGLMALVCMAGAASGQISVVSANGLARATAGNGSGSNQQTSTNVNGFTLSASKSFTNGSVSAQTSVSLGSPWTLGGSFSSSSGAPSQGEAGQAETQVEVIFHAATDMDIEYSGGYSVNSPTGFVDLDIRRVSDNSYVVGGSFPGFTHIAAGNYRLRMNTFNGYGSVSGGFNAEFRQGNDRCEFARVITGGSDTGNTEFASFDGQATCGSSNQSRSVWYKYTATRTGTLDVTTCGSSFDTVLSAYDTNTCPSGTGSQVACNDDAPAGAACGGRASAIALPVVQGETYYFRIGGYEGANGEYQINVGPVNDHCENAMEIGLGTTPFNNTFADTDGPVLNSCTNNGLDNQVNGDLWYVFTPNFSGSMVVDTCGSSFDTKVAVYINAPCVGHSTYLTCNDDACSTQSRTDSIQITQGYHYYIRVGGYRTNRGAGELHINAIPNPPCPADFNGDGFLDFFDYDDYVQCFESGICPPGRTADFNGDQFVDFFDYDDFVTAFENGC